MALSSDLVSQFVRATREEKQSKETTVYGTVVDYDGRKYVKLDGSELLTPISTTADAIDGERVTVVIKNHSAIVTGNISSPSARTDTVKKIDGTVQELGNKISQFEIIIADKVSVKSLEAEIARIDALVAEDVKIKGRLDANDASIQNLTAADVKINGRLDANDASIKNLDTNKLNAKDAAVMYANIDFANINMAAVQKLFSESGIIKDLIVSDGKITGELVGVTIKGDLIEGNTIVADKLVVKGEDGLYYKLNTDGVTTEAEQTDYNSLSGTVIQAKSITAEKIAVTDLVAFGATIGGFTISSSAIYSGVKDGPTNTTRGIYMDNEGQLAVGDTNNYLRYYKDADGVYKLEISANSIVMTTSGTTIEEEISGIKGEMSNIKDEVTTLLRIESSRGTVFKNDQVATVLSAVIYRGNTIIRDMETLRSVMGSSAYLEWSWQRINEDVYGVFSADDYRIGNDGFTFTLSPEDVDTKVTFMCTLNA